MAYEQLKLSNQLCFPVYAASRLITKKYQPYLEKLGITYPQYLVLIVLWEHGKITVSELSGKLLLNTNTLTPLLKRMMTMGLLNRQRSQEDERKVFIELTEKGRDLEEEAAKIPQQLADGLISETLSVEELIDLKEKLDKVIEHLKSQ
ncbi:MarR family winged helix-turn-helix transcriptional regulator [Marinilabilia rubra]|uniref:MarR family transcriptional regulator n=1 Tax=Marinilabilia rubra TaxID=2162893 RepID=A0A2U2BD32_9BACT|nr:MarR family transcriptional regulator [Marinilabilia rubra]PWE00937.1 MarR family transcriptional regulator [Marinilabilia rubra]